MADFSNIYNVNSQAPNFKITIKNSQITVKAKLNKNETICQREIDLFNSKFIHGLMRPKVIGEKKLEYIASGNISVKDFFGNGITKNDFFVVFAQLVECLKKIEWNDFDINKLVLNADYIFYNQITREVQFIYQPVDNTGNFNNIYVFIYDLINIAQGRVSDNDGFLEALSVKLSSMPGISPEVLERYIYSVYPQVYKQVRRSKKGDSQTLKPQKTYFEEKYEQENSGGLNQTGNGSGNAFGENNRFESNNSDYEDTDLLGGDTDFFNETALLDESDGTALYGNNTAVRPYLIRLNTYEKVFVDKPAFRIGKEKSYVDYFVASNNAVSRIHADIILKNGRYFIKDNNSTNHTFINGTMIPIYQETEIFDGDSVMLANEPFEFHVG